MTQWIADRDYNLEELSLKNNNWTLENLQNWNKDKTFNFSTPIKRGTLLNVEGSTQKMDAKITLTKNTDIDELAERFGISDDDIASFYEDNKALFVNSGGLAKKGTVTLKVPTYAITNYLNWTQGVVDRSKVVYDRKKINYWSSEDGKQRALAAGYTEHINDPNWLAEHQEEIYQRNLEDNAENERRRQELYTTTTPKANQDPNYAFTKTDGTVGYLPNNLHIKNYEKYKQTHPNATVEDYLKGSGLWDSRDDIANIAASAGATVLEYTRTLKPLLDENGNVKRDLNGKTLYAPLLDENGNLRVDQNGNPLYLTEVATVTRPISRDERYFRGLRMNESGYQYNPGDYRLYQDDIHRTTENTEKVAKTGAAFALGAAAGFTAVPVLFSSFSSLGNLAGLYGMYDAGKDIRRNGLTLDNTAELALSAVPGLSTLGKLNKGFNVASNVARIIGSGSLVGSGALDVYHGNYLKGGTKLALGTWGLTPELSFLNTARYNYNLLNTDPAVQNAAKFIDNYSPSVWNRLKLGVLGAWNPLANSFYRYYPNGYKQYLQSNWLTDFGNGRVVNFGKNLAKDIIFHPILNIVAPELSKYAARGLLDWGTNLSDGVKDVVSTGVGYATGTAGIGWAKDRISKLLLDRGYGYLYESAAEGPLSTFLKNQLKTSYIPLGNLIDVSKTASGASARLAFKQNLTDEILPWATKNFVNYGAPSLVPMGAQLTSYAFTGNDIGTNLQNSTGLNSTIGNLAVDMTSGALGQKYFHDLMKTWGIMSGGKKGFSKNWDFFKTHGHELTDDFRKKNPALAKMYDSLPSWMKLGMSLTRLATLRPGGVGQYQMGTNESTGKLLGSMHFVPYNKSDVTKLKFLNYWYNSNDTSALGGLLESKGSYMLGNTDLGTGNEYEQLAKLFGDKAGSRFSTGLNVKIVGNAGESDLSILRGAFFKNTETGQYEKLFIDGKINQNARKFLASSRNNVLLGDAAYDGKNYNGTMFDIDGHFELLIRTADGKYGSVNIDVPGPGTGATDGKFLEDVGSSLMSHQMDPSISITISGRRRLVGNVDKNGTSSVLKLLDPELSNADYDVITYENMDSPAYRFLLSKYPKEYNTLVQARLQARDMNAKFDRYSKGLLNNEDIQDLNNQINTLQSNLNAEVTAMANAKTASQLQTILNRINNILALLDNLGKVHSYINNPSLHPELKTVYDLYVLNLAAPLKNNLPALLHRGIAILDGNVIPDNMTLDDAILYRLNLRSQLEQLLLQTLNSGDADNSYISTAGQSVAWRTKSGKVRLPSFLVGSTDNPIELKRSQFELLPDDVLLAILNTQKLPGILFFDNPSNLSDATKGLLTTKVKYGQTLLTLLSDLTNLKNSFTLDATNKKLYTIDNTNNLPNDLKKLLTFDQSLNKYTISKKDLNDYINTARLNIKDGSTRYYMKSSTFRNISNLKNLFTFDKSRNVYTIDDISKLSNDVKKLLTFDQSLNKYVVSRKDLNNFITTTLLEILSQYNKTLNKHKIYSPHYTLYDRKGGIINILNNNQIFYLNGYCQYTNSGKQNTSSILPKYNWFS